MDLTSKLEECYSNKTKVVYAVVSPGYTYYDNFIIDTFRIEPNGSIAICAEDREIFIKRPWLYKYDEESEAFEYDQDEIRNYIEFIQFCY